MEYNCQIRCGKCCKVVYIPCGDLNETDYLRWIKLHTRVKIEVFRGLQCIVLPYKCSKLKHNKCTIYEDRPEMCKKFRCEKMDNYLNNL